MKGLLHHMTMTFKAIIFDMDGLLVDSETVWGEVETELVESRGFSYTDEVRSQIIGLRIDEFMQILQAHYQMQESVESLIDELLDRMLKAIPDRVKPQPGAIDIVNYVHEQGIPCAIASSSPMSIINTTIATQGWDDVFVKRFSADDDERGKPAPDVYLRAAKELGVNPSEALALEDSRNGARAAVAAGLTCYAVPDMSHITDISLFDEITPHVFRSLSDVLDQLKA